MLPPWALMPPRPWSAHGAKEADMPDTPSVTAHGAMNTRTETDSMGSIAVPANKYWGAQTQRSLERFNIGTERMPLPLVWALGVQKKASALANMELALLCHICRLAHGSLARHV